MDISCGTAFLLFWIVIILFCLASALESIRFEKKIERLFKKLGIEDD